MFLLTGFKFKEQRVNCERMDVSMWSGLIFLDLHYCTPLLGQSSDADLAYVNAAMNNSLIVLFLFNRHMSRIDKSDDGSIVAAMVYFAEGYPCSQMHEVSGAREVVPIILLLLCS